MTLSIPPAPAFGAAAPLPRLSEETLALLAQRRSCSPQTLAAPVPQGEDLANLLRLAARTPDHGKLFPWRFVILEGDAKGAFAQRLEALARERPDAEKAAAVLFKLKAPPLAIAVVSRLVPSHIDEWEQRLSAGAVCMTLSIAARAMGYGVNWITDWYAYDERALTVLGVAPGEKVAGFILIGTPTEPSLERVRPDVAALTTVWG